MGLEIWSFFFGLSIQLFLFIPFPTTLSGPSYQNDSNEVSNINNQKAFNFLWSHMDSVYMLRPCNRSREIIQNSTWGRVSDGPFNYTQYKPSILLILTAPPGHWIPLKIDRVRTECSYDYLFVVDGPSYVHPQSRLLASFIGASDPYVTLLAQSGYMLISLFSDPNYVLEGFQATYSVSPCPANCSHAGDCIEEQNEHICKCVSQRIGVACESIVLPTESATINRLRGGISLESENNRITLSNSWNPPVARVGHSLVQMGKNVYIFGGFDLNAILNNLFSVNVETNQREQLKPKLPPLSSSEESSREDTDTLLFWPTGRFGHAAVSFKEGFFIHGGYTTNSTISNDLFYYNVTSNSWANFSNPHVSNIPRLMYHTMTPTPSGEIFVFGGNTDDGSFSSTLYKFFGDNPTQWTVVVSSCCGKPILRRLLGHTMTYWPQKNALILFGGLTSSDFGRFSKLSNQLWIFLLHSSTWLPIDYRKNGGLSSGINPERAFHSAHLVDQYLIIYGGYTHVHNKDESCYSSQMLIYNLECQMFLPPSPVISIADMNMKPNRGVFGHRSAIVDNDLILVGGYRGYLSQSISKVPLPFTKSKSAECISFDRWRCSGDPRCGWCPTSSRCFDKLTGATNCTTNLQTVQCPGICPVLTNCQSCVGVNLLCVWCGTLEQCVVN